MWRSRLLILSTKVLMLAAILALMFFANVPASSQTQVHPNPDCQFYFTFSTTSGALPAGSGFDNRQQGCNTWSVVYFNSGFSPVSLLLQTAPNNAGVAGTWGTGFPVQQAILTGSNPQTSTTGGFLWITGMNAWVRVQLTATGSGIVTGAAFGWRIPSAQ